MLQLGTRRELGQGFAPAAIGLDERAVLPVHDQHEDLPKNVEHLTQTLTLVHTDRYGLVAVTQRGLGIAF